jgi:hypothetical protein
MRMLHATRHRPPWRRPVHQSIAQICVTLEMLLYLEPELVPLGGALLTDSTQERHAEIHM